MSHKKYISPLSDLELEWLCLIEDSYLESKRVRTRAQAIRLSHLGFSIQEILLICQSTHKTVSSWLSRWEELGFDSLPEKPRSGRSRILTPEEEAVSIEKVQECPTQSKRAFEKILQETQKNFSFRTFKRVLKKNYVGSVQESP